MFTLAILAASPAPCEVTFSIYNNLPHTQNITLNAEKVRQRCGTGGELLLFAIQRQGVRRHLDMAQQLCDPDQSITINKNRLRCQLRQRANQ